jgi:hypothetical protein
VQVGHTDRLLAQLRSSEGRQLMVGAMPASGLVVPPGGDISVSPDGMILTDADGVPQYYVHSSGIVVGYARPKPDKADKPDEDPGNGDAPS